MSEKESNIPMGTKVAYGAPSFAGAAMGIPIAIHLTIFYSDTILVPLGVIALVKALARALDAITDPVMGWASDSARTRWGRRRPWIALGAPLAAVMFYLMFTPPVELDAVTAATWFMVTYTLYYVFHTLYIIPHISLGLELTSDYNERSTLFGIREAFVIAGTLVAAVMPPVLISIMGDTRDGYSTFAIIFGSLLVILYLNLVFRVSERPDYMTREANPLIPGVRRVMRNSVFRLLLFVYLVGSLTGAIPGLMMPYFTKYVLQPENPQLWLAIFLGSYFLGGFLALPVWVWLARRYEKKPVWLAGFVPGIVGLSAMYFLEPGDLILTAVILGFAGTGFSAGLFLSPAMKADVIDYDEFHTGKRREAQFSALWTVMTKFMVIPSMSLPLAILASVGYAPNVEQTDTVKTTIKAIFCLGPAITAMIAFGIGWFYPLTKIKHREILDGIESHKSGLGVNDPITGHYVLPPNQRGIDEKVGWELDHSSLAELEMLNSNGKSSLSRQILMLLVFVVIGFVCFTFTVYHLVRFRHCYTLMVPESSVIQQHIDVTRQMKNGMGTV
jgi:GPH family glycoside/pentoside/hexuronide:cation symporter